MSVLHSNCKKYLAIIYPYISLLIYRTSVYIIEYTCKCEIPEDINYSLFIIISSSSVIFGISQLKNFYHKDIIFDSENNTTKLKNETNK